MRNEPTEAVLLDMRDGILVIHMNRPEVRNAINAELAAGIRQAIDLLESREDLRVGILHGAGGTFCAGLDLKAFARGEMPRLGKQSLLGLGNRVVGKPLIAAVEGYAVAGGFETMLACDMVVAARDAKMGLAEVKRGLAASGGGLYLLPRKVPVNIAMEMALTGDFISGERAAQWGLVNRLTEPGGALAAALQLARTIADNAPLSVTASKKSILAQHDWPVPELRARQLELTQHVLDSEDAREGARAFAEKRKPQWTGR